MATTVLSELKGMNTTGASLLLPPGETEFIQNFYSRPVFNWKKRKGVESISNQDGPVWGIFDLEFDNLIIPVFVSGNTLIFNPTDYHFDLPLGGDNLDFPGSATVTPNNYPSNPPAPLNSGGQNTIQNPSGGCVAHCPDDFYKIATPTINSPLLCLGNYASGNITFSWNAPTLYANGNPLPGGAITGYVLRIRLQSLSFVINYYPGAGDTSLVVPVSDFADQDCLISDGYIWDIKARGNNCDTCDSFVSNDGIFGVLAAAACDSTLINPPPTVTVPYASLGNCAACSNDAGVIWDGVLTRQAPPSGCTWAATANDTINGKRLNAGGTGISFVATEWQLTIQCLQLPGTPFTIWAGAKATGTSPVGTYLRGSGCSAQATVVVT